MNKFGPSGAKSSKDLTGGILMAPSNLSVPVKDKVLETPTSMNQDEVNLWIQSFVSAARRAVSAGFDFIELHAAHGYGINQWLSSITNARTDSYGGTLNQRLKILSEIISEIQKALPTIMISVRIPGKDFLENGLSLEDGIFIAKHLGDLGVNLINVSSGIGTGSSECTAVGESVLLRYSTGTANGTATALATGLRITPVTTNRAIAGNITTNRTLFAA